MNLTSDQVRKVSKLANLPISFEEEKKYSQQLSKILDYIEQLNRADTSKVEPAYNITPNTNITREDEVNNNLTQEEALQNAPQKKNGLFVTKGVFEE